MICSERFKKLAESKGYKIKKASNMWFDYATGKLTRYQHRPDLLSVQYRNKHFMTIPKKMYSFTKEGYKAIHGSMFKDYFWYEHRLKNWDILIKRTPQWRDQ